MVFITGHTLSVVSGVPVLRSRAGLSGYSQYDKVLQSGIGCEKSLPVINSSYDSSGNLTWDASNVTDVYIRSYCYGGGCYYSLFQSPYYVGYYDDFESIPVLNNSASGYEEPYFTTDIFGNDIHCIYSVYGSNKCCSLESGCGIGTACLGFYYRYLHESHEFPPYDPEDYPNNLNYSCLDEAYLCWNLDRDLEIANYTNDFTVTLNDEEVEYSDCRVIPYGSAMEESYTLAVKNNCGTNVVKTVHTLCCQRKDNAIIEIAGLTDVDYEFSEDSIYKTYHCYSSPESYVAGSVSETLNINLSALNGTYAIPLCYDSVTSDECRSKTINTGIKLIATYTFSRIYNGVYNYISNSSLPPFTRTYDGYETITYIYEADVFINENGIILSNSIVNYILSQNEHFIINGWTPTGFGEYTPYVEEGDFLPINFNTTYSCEDTVPCHSNLGNSQSKCNDGGISFNESGICNEYLTANQILYILDFHNFQSCGCNNTIPFNSWCTSIFNFQSYGGYDVFPAGCYGGTYADPTYTGLRDLLNAPMELTYRISFS